MALDQAHYDVVSDEMERHREDTETSKLAHWRSAAVYERRHKLFIGVPATVLSLFLTWMLSSDVKKLFSEPGILQGVVVNSPVILSLLVSLLSGLGAFLNFNELAVKHRSTAENLHGLWRDCKNWKTDFPDFSCCEKAVAAVQGYRKRLNDINRDAPQIPKWAWKSVSRQLAEGSTAYKNDAASSTDNKSG